jgi:hypothetical protein
MATVMELERCPYDMSPISVEAVGDALMISCDACGAAWEIQDSTFRRLRAPDAVTMNAVREGLFPQEVVCGKRVTETVTVDDAAR